MNTVDCDHKLSTYERKLLGELSTILAPFEKITLLVQGEQNVTSSLAIPCTLGLKHQLFKISSDYNCKMVSTLKSSVNKRLSQFENDNVYKIASVLDFRFKLRWAEQDIDINTQLLREKFLEIGACDMNENDEETSSSPAKKLNLMISSTLCRLPQKEEDIFLEKSMKLTDIYLNHALKCLKIPLNIGKLTLTNTPIFPNLHVVIYQFKLHLPLLEGFSA